MSTQPVKANGQDKAPRRRAAWALLGGTLALVFAIAAINSYQKNRKLVEQTESVSGDKDLAMVGNSIDVTAMSDELDALRRQVELLLDYKEHGPPFSYRGPMYEGDRLLPPLLEHYQRRLEKVFVGPVKERLEKKLRSKSADVILNYKTLKAYLLLDDKVHLQNERPWLAERLTDLWIEHLRKAGDLPPEDLKPRLRPNVDFYVDLLRRGVIAGSPLDAALIAASRDALADQMLSARYYDRIVTALMDERSDETGGDAPGNLVYPPISLPNLFNDQPDSLRELKSARKLGIPDPDRIKTLAEMGGAPPEKTDTWYEVQGPFTLKGYKQVRKGYEDILKDMNRETWVLPFTEDEVKEGDRTQRALRRAWVDYEDEYARRWEGFFRDIVIDMPSNNAEALQKLRVLSAPEGPYFRVLRALDENTQVPDPPSGAAAPGVNRIKTHFKPIVSFGIAVDGSDAPKGTKLSQYLAVLKQLVGKLEAAKRGSNIADTPEVRAAFEAAASETRTLLQSLDERGQELLRPLLLRPLKQP